MTTAEQIVKAKKEKTSIKCVVWDLDNTLWDGVLSEDKEVQLKEEVKQVIIELDNRGILNSIASKNNEADAFKKLKELDLFEYFLYPQINWNPKSQSISNIAKSINIGLDSIAFIDDQNFERDEVLFHHPDVYCVDAIESTTILDLPMFMPRFITPESKLRRSMYHSDILRNRDESESVGTNEDFLKSLEMKFEIRMASEDDLQRAEELTIRTNQLNTTGYTYSYNELNKLRLSDNHLLLVASLKDKYGTYGTIGLVLIEKNSEAWLIKLLLMSCRVMSRGVGTILMSYIMKEAKKNSVKLHAHFIPNGRNRMMLVSYKFSGFTDIEKNGDLIVMENNLERIQEYPDYVDIKILGEVK